MTVTNAPTLVDRASAALASSPLQHATTSDGSQSTAVAADTVEATIDVLFILAVCAAGAVAGFLAAAIIFTSIRGLTKTPGLAGALIKRVRTPTYCALMVWGTWAGLQYSLADADLASWSNGTLVVGISHALLILAIAAATWIVYAAAWLFEDAARLRQEADKGHSRRFETQAQVIRRLGQMLIVLIGIFTALYTFEAARQAMTTLLASAGVLSVVVGLAAQQTLGNLFAGLQLAFTDAIRVGDVVVPETDGESGAIEEITLSYVVVRLWDERRLIVPSKNFTSNNFENWTRRAARQLGTVEIKLDWAAPMTLIRHKVEELLVSTDLWDGRTWAVQVTDSDANTITVRILVSAANSGKLWDLRCHLREHLIEWIVRDEPWARPVSRTLAQEPVKVEVDTSREEAARLAREIAGIDPDRTGSGGLPAVSAGLASSRSDEGEASAPTGSPLTPLGQVVEEVTADPFHALRLQAARRKSKRERRRAMSQRQRDLAEGRAVGEEPGAGRGAGTSAAPPSSHVDQSAVTQVLSATTVQRAVQGTGERLYSGSADADERSDIWAGPGDEALAEREAAARRRAAKRDEQSESQAGTGRSLTDTLVDFTGDSR